MCSVISRRVWPASTNPPSETSSTDARRSPSGVSVSIVKSSEGSCTAGRLFLADVLVRQASLIVYLKDHNALPTSRIPPRTEHLRGTVVSRFGPETVPARCSVESAVTEGHEGGCAPIWETHRLSLIHISE